MSVSLSCPRCHPNAVPLDEAFRCSACGAEHASVRVDEGPAVAMLLDASDAEPGLAATTRLLEALDRTTDGWLETEPRDDGYLLALATFGGAHYGRWAAPPVATPSMEWIGRVLESVPDLPDGPALVLGAATAGEALALGDRPTVALDGSIPLLAFASGLAARDQWLPVQATPGRYRAHRLTLPAEVRERLRRVQLVAADARDPPLPAGTFALVVALNLLDSITHPQQVLLAARRLLAPGGAVLLSTPYNWDDDVTAPERRLDAEVPASADHAAAVEARLRTLLPDLRCVWRDRDVAWRLRVHDRLVCEFRLHAMLLRHQARAPTDTADP